MFFKNKLKIQFLFFFFSIAILSIAQIPLSNRVANYQMNVFLDTENKTMQNETAFLWRNPSADTVRSIHFHLYYNAFKNDQSTFMTESNGTFVSDEIVEECQWGWTEITKLTDAAGNDLTQNLNYIQPNGRGSDDDETVLEVVLENPVLPYDSVQLNFSWEAKIPKLRIRTGYNQDYFFMAQWFPKAGVYEAKGVRCSEEGQWNCNAYHRYGEYYADFGNYEVTLDVPDDYVVGASGVRVEEQVENHRKRVTYRAEDVIDFTWTAYPHFKVVHDKWANVNIRLLHHPDRVCVAERYLDAAKKCFEYLDEHIGTYPYPTLTIVDPPYHGIRSSGMEYPTLVTGAGFYCLPYGIRATETLTVHEMIHQYFMQMVATNEQEEAWMDEGFTSYYEGRIIDHYYNYIMENDWLGFRVSNKSWRRYRYINMEDLRIGQPAQAAWEFAEKGGGYSPLTYGKTAVTLNSLEGLVGIETMDEIMKTYFERWKFKHPCGQDFIAIVSEVVRKNHGTAFGETMDWFFEETIYSSKVCDYAVLDISNQKWRGPVGFLSDRDACVQDEPTEDSPFLGRVQVARLGDMTLPMELFVRFENGDTQTVLWKGVEKMKIFEFEHSHPIEAAILDPQQKIDLDINCVNNSIDHNTSKAGIWKYTSGWMRWMQNIMQSLSFLI